jgi:hypothetical protein
MQRATLAQLRDDASELARFYTTKTHCGPPGHSASLKQSVFNSQKALTYAEPMKIRQA